MWTCYTDAADIGQSKAAAQTHQMWTYDTATSQLKLTKAPKMSCSVERGVDYLMGDIVGGTVGAHSLEDCCELCTKNPACTCFSYDTLAGSWIDNPLEKSQACFLKKANSPSPSPACPGCSHNPNQVSGL
jgi:hypothetical protein